MFAVQLSEGDPSGDQLAFAIASACVYADKDKLAMLKSESQLLEGYGLRRWS